MKNNKKKSIISLLILFSILLIVVGTLTGCATKTQDSDKLDKKVNQEMQYVDTQLLTMLNLLNNITVKNYSVVSEKSSQSSTTSSQSQEGGTSEQNEKSGSDSSSDSQSSSGNASQTSTISGMQRESVLISSKGTDWTILKSNVEIFYSSWSPIVLDLYKLNINKDDILNFNTTLDNAVIFMKNEDKANTALALATLYSYIPKYIESYSNDSLSVNLAKIKSCIVNAYAAIETDNWEEVRKQLSNAENNFTVILNQVSDDQKTYNINKSYVLFKELQNSLTTQDKDLFYIKYKNVMEELNLLKQL